MDNINRNTVINDNADPITGEPGSHPIGTAVGGTGGAAAGAAIGAVGGPLGMLIGGAIGAIVGGVAGSSVGEMLDPTVEYDYWQEAHTERPYYVADYNYETDYHPAYAVGYATRAHYPKTARFEDHESELEQRWNEVKGASRMTWLQATDAVRDGWDKTHARLNGEVYEPKEYVHYAGHRAPIEAIHSGEDKPHPVATGTGALSGAAAGAAVGTAVGGPVGTVVGGAVGAIAGSKVGHEAGELVNPTDSQEAHEKPHPIASGTGALGGAAAGAAVGTAVGGPVGTVVGGLAGAVAGGAGGQEVGEAINPTDQNDVQKEANPVSSGTGMVGGAAAGAAIGAAGGPIGSVVGGAVGAVVGATAGNAVANAFEGNTEEDNYWRTQHVSTEYYNPQYDYDTDYRNAYGYGYAQRKRYGRDQSFDLVEQDLQRNWAASRGNSRLEWVDAKHAVRDAWNRPLI